MKKDKKVKAKTWQVSFFIAAIACVCFVLLNCAYVRNFMQNEIPNQSYRTFAAALILAVVVFMFSGLILHYICPEKERVRKTMTVSPYAIFDR